MVFALLTEVVVFHIQIIIVQFGFRGFKGLSVLSLASTSGAEAVVAAGAWARTLLIQVRMNSWKRSLFSVGAGVGSKPGDGLRPRSARLGVGRLKAGLSRWVRGIVGSGERKAESGAETESRYKDKEGRSSLSSKRAG